MIKGGIFSVQSVKKGLRIFDNIYKIATGEGDDYTLGVCKIFLIWKMLFKLIRIDLAK